MRPVPQLLSLSPPDPEAAATWVARAPALVGAGADGLLLRVLMEPGESAEVPTRAWLQALLETGATVLMHARTPGGVGLAAELGIGLHLPDGTDMSARMAGLLGASCHDRVGLRRAAKGCDYALLSPVFAPLSKGSDSRPLGIGAFEKAVADSQIPVLALGGIDAARVASCLRAGAYGVAGIGAFGDPESVAEMAEALRSF